MGKILSVFKLLLPIVFLSIAGSGLIYFANKQESKLMLGYDLFQAAQNAAEIGEYQEAYALYLQSSYELDNVKDKSIALYEAASVGWQQGIADYRTLVSLYQQMLRYQPGFYEAGFNLEYLYLLKSFSSDELPGADPGSEPSREGTPTRGDI